MAFRTAERKKAKLRLGLVGPSGSGKTYSSLLIAKGIGGRIALIDTENGSGDLYAGMKDIPQYDISTMSAPYTVEKYLEAIKEAEQAGYSVIIIDSLSHAWAGEGGLLDKQGKIADSGRGNSYTAWRQVTPLHNQLIEKMLTSPCHIIATMRTKVDYVVEADSKGKQVPKKIGLAPIQREGMDYEFTVVFDIDLNHNAQVSKDRTASFDGQIFKPGEETGSTLKLWLDTGSDNIGAEKPITTKPKTAPKEKTADRAQLINTLKDITLQGLGFKPEELAPWLKRILEREDITGFDSMSDTELITAVNTAQTELKNRG
ncbi:MAG: hypothetical protein EOM12_13890 [Verrucomicrobiae bacterium]|nr:hypothetical protein [Verrucomicrobiae bacterium]